MRQLSVSHHSSLDHEESFIKSKSGQDFVSQDDNYEQCSRRKSSSVKETVSKKSTEKKYSNT